MTPHHQSPGAIRREWDEWRAMWRQWRLARQYSYANVLRAMLYSCARNYADARALRAYLCALADNE